MSTTKTNVLAAGIEIVGTIRFQNDMHIDGKIDGQIESESGKVTIGEQAYIKGNIKAGEINVYGRVEGNMQSQRCHLHENSVVTGDVTSKGFSMNEGAKLSGHTEIG